MERPLAEEEKQFLLRLARQTLEAQLEGEPLPSATPSPGPLTEARGAFVTLTRSGELRGCIGHVVGVAPLWRSVRENVLNAALRDPRFPPVEASELPSLHIEISALTPLREVATPDEVIVGRHGVMIENGPFRGLLLPQVATEYGWDRATFLDHTCRKAGLQAGCWRRPDTRIHVFSAEIFSEQQ
ncbi:MAG: AmmeMemoRadiSam system protein A [Acidobacteria bacterium]|nr:AmmeMemoRadiSam system protein A [Acidobacteriota bacterium]